MIAKLDRLHLAILESVQGFRVCADSQALDALHEIVLDMESLLEFQQHTGVDINLENILSLASTLLGQLKARDIIGVADTLEFSLLPQVNQWREDVMK